MFLNCLLCPSWRLVYLPLYRRTLVGKHYIRVTEPNLQPPSPPAEYLLTTKPLQFALRLSEVSRCSLELRALSTFFLVLFA